MDYTKQLSKIFKKPVELYESTTFENKFIYKIEFDEKDVFINGNIIELLIDNKRYNELKIYVELRRNFSPEDAMCSMRYDSFVRSVEVKEKYIKDSLELLNAINLISLFDEDDSMLTVQMIWERGWIERYEENKELYVSLVELEYEVILQPYNNNFIEALEGALSIEDSNVFKIYLFLCKVYDEDLGFVKMSIEEISDGVEKSISTVKRSLKKLKEDNLIVKIKDDCYKINVITVVNK